MLLIQIHILNGKQCRSRSVGFFRSHPIWICTVCKGGAYQGSAGPGLMIRSCRYKKITFATLKAKWADEWPVSDIFLIFNRKQTYFIQVSSRKFEWYVKSYFPKKTNKASSDVLFKFSSYMLISLFISSKCCQNLISSIDNFVLDNKTDCIDSNLQYRSN